MGEGTRTLQKETASQGHHAWLNGSMDDVNGPLINYATHALRTRMCGREVIREKSCPKSGRMKRDACQKNILKSWGEKGMTRGQTTLQVGNKQRDGRDVGEGRGGW